MITVNNQAKDIIQIKAVYTSGLIVELLSGGLCDIQMADRKYLLL